MIRLNQIILFVQNRSFILRKVLFIIGTFLGILLLSYQIFQAYLGFRKQDLSIQQPWALWIALILITPGLFLLIEAWIRLMQAININLVPQEVRSGFALSFLARYIPGSVWGYISRSEWLWQNYQITYFQSNYVSILEVLLVILSNVWTILVCLALLASQLSLLIPVLALFALTTATWLLIPSQALPRINRLIPSAYNIQISKANTSLQKWLLPLGFLVINWLSYGLALVFVCAAFGIWQGNEWIYRWVLLSRDYCIAWLCGYLIIFLPSGLGVRELVLSTLLVDNLQLEPSLANGVSITLRFLATLAEFICISLLVLFNLRHKQQPKTKQEGSD